MKFYIGASEPVDTLPLSELIKWYSGEQFSHIYIRYTDSFTGQVMISESSHGEAHKIELSKWYLKNKIVKEYEIEVGEELFRVILSKINSRLQTSYSELNVLGVPFYDLGERLNSPFIMGLTIKIFSDGVDSTICSESASFTLGLLGIQFNRPNDFVRPDQVVTALEKAARSEDYIKKVT